MTTVVYRDGIIVADTLACTGNGLTAFEVEKILRGEKTAYGVCGNLMNLGALRKWVEDGEDFDEPPELSEEFECLRLEIQGRNCILSWSGANFRFVPITSEFAAIGSGSELAVGAMRKGASAEEALEIAASANIFTGPNTQKIVMKRSRRGKVSEKPKG